MTIRQIKNFLIKKIEKHKAVEPDYKFDIVLIKCQDTLNAINHYEELGYKEKIQDSSILYKKKGEEDITIELGILKNLIDLEYFINKKKADRRKKYGI